jgi:hypothetical protein
VASSGETLIAPAGTVATLIAGTQATLLRGWAPDLERDIVEPAQVAGVETELLTHIGFAAIRS